MKVVNISSTKMMKKFSRVRTKLACINIIARVPIHAIVLTPSLRGANGSRECAPDDRLRDEAIHYAEQWIAPLAMTAV